MTVFEWVAARSVTLVLGLVVLLLLVAIARDVRRGARPARLPVLDEPPRPASRVIDDIDWSPWPNDGRGESL